MMSPIKILLEFVSIDYINKTAKLFLECDTDKRQV